MTQHNTGIEWTHIPGFKGETWNPIVGCSVISPGCANCYAMRVAGRRLDGNPKTPHYAGTTMASKAGPVWTGKVAMAGEKAFTAPLRWAKPRAVFVNSMGDLFHESVPDAWIDRVFAIMALRPQHIFIVLTKRAERMRAYMTRQCERGRWPAMDYAAILAATGQWNTPAVDLRNGWPLPNVWLGVSVEDQTRADERIPHLLATPAAVRFVSCEPLLGPVDLTKVTHRDRQEFGWLNYDPWLDALTGNYPLLDGCERRPHPNRLHWVIAGGESGKGARPMHPDWARGLRDQCKAAAVPFFFKQWGEWANRGRLFDPLGDTDETDAAQAALDEYFIELEDGNDWHDPDRVRLLDGSGHNWANENAQPPPCVHVMTRIGKRAAGHKLDDEIHHNWPEVAA